MDQRSVRNVVQRTCGTNLGQAVKSYFGTADSAGNLAIVLIPEARSKASTFLTIPANCACIIEKDGICHGELPAGRHQMGWKYRVAFIVTKQACTFNYSVKKAATRDNVMADVDLTLVFNIDQPQTFVYSLGATHFNNMLKAVAEEATRTLVRSIDHTAIYELRSSAADQMLAVLNRTFREFGILFVNTTVTNVTLPEDLSRCLEEASRIDSQMQEASRSQEFKLKQLNDQADLDLKSITLQNERAAADLEAKKETTRIESEARVDEAQKEAERAILKQKQASETARVKATAALRDEQTKAKMESERAILAAQQKAMVSKQQAQMEAARAVMKAETELQSAESDAKVVKLEADAEAANAAELAGERERELRREAVAALQKLAQQGKIVLSGSSCEQLLDALVSGESIY